MSSIRYEFSDEELNNFKPKLLYLTQSEYGDDWHSTPHYHPFLELLYVFEGKGEFLIDGQAFSLRRGDFRDHQSLYGTYGDLDAFRSPEILHLRDR